MQILHRNLGTLSVQDGGYYYREETPRRKQSCCPQHEDVHVQSKLKMINTLWIVTQCVGAVLVVGYLVLLFITSLFGLRLRCVIIGTMVVAYAVYSHYIRNIHQEVYSWGIVILFLSRTSSNSIDSRWLAAELCSV